LNSQRRTWPKEYKSKNGYRALRVNGLFGGGNKDNNSEDGQSKVGTLDVFSNIKQILQ